MNSSQEKDPYYNDLLLPNNNVEDIESIDKKLSEEELNRVIEMAWEDRTTFDSIKTKFGLSEQDVKRLMKSNLKFKSYVVWRKRVESCQTKHLKTRNAAITRFKCSLQRSITNNKISKRKKPW